MSPPAAAAAKSLLTLDLLKQQNADTSTAIIDFLQDTSDFDKLAAYEGALTVARDREDDAKLAQGIAFAQAKGVIDPDFVPEPYQEIDVLGQTPEQVADTILRAVQQDNNDNSKEDAGGKVIVLVGLSGTGKGTTVTQLRQKLQATPGGAGVVTWSNGNIFRAVTLLATTWCEQNNHDNNDNNNHDLTRALTKENLESFLQMLTFEPDANGHYDTHIQGLGLDLWVSQVQNTELKAPKVSKNIPTVAEATQGEVILFAAQAVETLGAHGFVVLLEGREQTVNYVRSPYRFTLVLSDESLIGKRRAAQRLMAAAYEAAPATDDQVVAAIQTALAAMVADMH